MEETIEDFIKRESKSANESVGIVKGAKWMQERMYSEEEVKFAYNEGQVSIISANYIRTEEWFEQFKKK
jgi:hypothetical protein